MTFPPQLKDLDTDDVVLTKVTSRFGSMFKVQNNKGGDVQFHLGTVKCFFGVQQDAYGQAPDQPIPANKNWVFSVGMGWDEQRTDEEEVRVKKLTDLYETIVDKLANLPAAQKLVNASYQPMSKAQIADRLPNPVKSKRSKTKKDEVTGLPVAYEPSMKWTIPFGFDNHAKVYDRFLKKKTFKTFVDEEDNEIDPTPEMAKKVIPSRSTIEVWGRVANVYFGDIPTIRFETLMVKRIGVEEQSLGQDIDTSDYAKFIDGIKASGDAAAVDGKASDDVSGEEEMDE
ncbi:MAG: hypothetical protein EOO38_20020 [Cytophagaceae bacterium]|nr:MAG: hypothetical protein EOO38_20020 [Cytophagaceae bacterium]